MASPVERWLRPSEIKKKFDISLEQLRYYRRMGYITEVDWSPGGRGEKNKRLPLYNPEEIKRVFKIIEPKK